MKKSIIAILLMASIGVKAQTLFTFGSKNVSRDEFFRAFNKNNTGETNEKAIREYLDLYTRFKLKVQAAYDKGYDSLPEQKTELSNFRGQIADSYLSDEGSVTALVEQAFARSQKDVHVAHIYISFNPDLVTDTLQAFRKAQEAFAKLQAGTPFETVALAYSTDPSVKINKGDLGFITLFSMPYNFETVAYETAAGKFSAPFKSIRAYHIFKTIETRPAAGRMKAAQIQLAFPPEATDGEKTAVRLQADSIYKALQGGASFGELASKYSSDNMSYQSGGVLPEFGVGKYEPAFENAAFALTRDGEISKPVLTSFGYHLILRLGRIRVNSDVENVEAIAALKQSVQADGRMETAKKALARKTLSTAGYKKGNFNAMQLAVYADSSWNGKHLPQTATMNNNTVLFSFPKLDVTAGNYSAYLRAVKDAPELYRGKSMDDLFVQYTETVATEYYKNHLEEFNPEFYYQLKEFKEGNLLFEVMQKEVWDKAAADTVGLKAFFKANSSKYWWEKSADVILFTCSDSLTAVKARAAFNRNKKDWKSIVMNSDGTVQADSARFEIPQIPVADISLIRAGYTSPVVKNPSDNIGSFLYVVKLYNDKQLRNYEDAKGFVVNDFQLYVEDKWIKELAAKYPVKVDEKVLSTLWK